MYFAESRWVVNFIWSNQRANANEVNDLILARMYILYIQLEVQKKYLKTENEGKSLV